MPCLAFSDGLVCEVCIVSSCHGNILTVGKACLAGRIRLLSKACIDTKVSLVMISSVKYPSIECLHYIYFVSAV